MICQFCKKEIPEGSKLCPFCGNIVRNNINDNQNTSIQQYGVQGKSKLAAGLLGIFLGALGIHNFYLGYKTKGIIQLCITLLTCGAGAIVSAIWGLIEGIMILCGSITVDGYGNPLIDNYSSVVVNQYNGNVTNNVGNYNNDFKVKINEKKDDGDNTLIVGDVISGSISVGDNARIEDINTHEFISRKVLSIVEDGMKVSFSMDKNIVIRIEKIDKDNTGKELIR